MLTANHKHIHHKPNLNFSNARRIGIPQVTQDQFKYILNDHTAGAIAWPYRNIYS